MLEHVHFFAPTITGLHLDECLSTRLAEPLLDASGLPVSTNKSEGLSGCRDAQLLRFCFKNRKCLITRDKGIPVMNDRRENKNQILLCDSELGNDPASIEEALIVKLAWLEMKFRSITGAKPTRNGNGK